MQQSAYVIISSLFTWPVSQVSSAVYCCTSKWIGSWLLLRVLVLQELLGGPARSASPGLLGNLLGSSEGPRASGPLHGLLHKGPSPPLFPQRAPSSDYFNSHLQPSAGDLVKLRASVFIFVLRWFRLVKPVRFESLYETIRSGLSLLGSKILFLPAPCDSREEICWESSSIFTLHLQQNTCMSVPGTFLLRTLLRPGFQMRKRNWCDVASVDSAMSRHPHTL